MDIRALLPSGSEWRDVQLCSSFVDLEWIPYQQALHDFMGYRLRTVNLYHIAPKYVRLELILRMAGKGWGLYKALKFALCCIGREILCWKQSSWMWSNESTMVTTYSCRYSQDLGSPSATRLPFVSTASTVTVELVVVVARSPSRVMPFVSDNGSHRRVNTAATLQAVYLLWLFLHITTTCILSIIGLIRRRSLESFAHVQTVDTRPLFEYK